MDSTKIFSSPADQIEYLTCIGLFKNCDKQVSELYDE